MKKEKKPPRGSLDELLATLTIRCLQHFHFKKAERPSEISSNSSFHAQDMATTCFNLRNGSQLTVLLVWGFDSYWQVLAV